MIKQALILAAGNGKRLSALGMALPKPLINVAGIPILRRILLDARSVGVCRFVIVTGYLGDKIKEYFSENPIANTVIDWIHNEDYCKANGISALKARAAFQHNFLLLMSDHIFERKTLRALCQYKPTDGESVLCVDKKINSIFDLEDATKVKLYGDSIVAIGKNLTEYDAIDTGMFLCNPYLFEALERSIRHGDCALSDGIRELAGEGRIRGFDIRDGLWQDIDTHASLRHAERMLEERRAKSEGRGAKSEGRRAKGEGRKERFSCLLPDQQ
jgi:choline kinase